MRITFLVNHDLPALLALNILLPSLKEHQVTVFFTQKNTRSTNQQLVELAEFESKQIEASQTLANFSKYGATLLNKINTEDYQRFVDTKPDLAISIRHMSILKSKVIGTPKLGIINLHSGLLPAYQGVMATFWALLNKETHIGTTLHFIEDASIDTGSIISTSSIEANYQRSYFWNVLNIYKAGCENILRAISNLENGKQLVSEPQSGPAHYYTYPNSQDIDKSGLSLFNDNDNPAYFL